MESLPNTAELLKISALMQQVSDLLKKLNENPCQDATQLTAYNTETLRIVKEYSFHIDDYAKRYTLNFDALKKEREAVQADRDATVAATRELQAATREAMEARDRFDKGREDMMRLMNTIQANYEKIIQHLNTSNAASAQTTAEVAGLRKDLEENQGKNQSMMKTMQGLSEQCVTKDVLQSELKKLGLIGDTINERVATMGEMHSSLMSEIKTTFDAAMERSTTNVLTGVTSFLQQNQTFRQQLPLSGSFRAGRPVTDPAFAGLLGSHSRGFLGRSGEHESSTGNDDTGLEEGVGAVNIGARARSSSSRRRSTHSSDQDAAYPPFGSSAPAASGFGFSGFTGPRPYQPLDPHADHSRPSTSGGPPVQKKPTLERVGQDVGEAAFAEEAAAGGRAEGAAEGPGTGATTTDEPALGGEADADLEGKPLRINISSVARINNSVLNDNMKAKLVKDLGEKNADSIVRHARRNKNRKLVCWHVHEISKTQEKYFPAWSQADFDHNIECSACRNDPTRQCFKITEDSLGFELYRRPATGLMVESSGFLLAATAQQHREQHQKDLENER